MSTSRRRPTSLFPARHGGDVGLHGGVAVALGDLRVAARKEGRLGGTRFPAALFATFADFVDGLPAIVLTPLKA